MELCGIPKVKVLSFALSISLEDQIVMTLLAQAMCQQYSQKVMLRVQTEQILALITVLEEFCHFNWFSNHTLSSLHFKASETLIGKHASAHWKCELCCYGIIPSCWD